jgi:hypothetical protein
LAVQKFLEKHGSEVRRIVKGDRLLEAGLNRLEEVAKIGHSDLDERFRGYASSKKIMEESGAVNGGEILFRRLVRAFLEKHGDEVRRIAKGDILLEAGLKRLKEVAGISENG